MSNSRINVLTMCLAALSLACFVNIMFGQDAERRAASRNAERATLGVNVVDSGDSRGITITRVRDNTPARHMDLRPNDRITMVNGRPVRSAEEFISAIRNMNPDEEVELTIARSGNELTVRSKLIPYNQTDAESVSRTESSNNNDEYENYQRVINRNRSNSDEPISTDEFIRDSQRSAERAVDDKRFNENRQTSFEDRDESSPPPTGDVEARLARVEEQLDRITQALEALRDQIGTGRLSASRDTTGPELRPRTPAQARPNEIPVNSRQMRVNDRWNTENRFEQADLAGARERANLEAARRRANQTGARLQQDAARDLQRTAPANRNPVPPEPTTQEPR